jgi:6-phosphogluconolactonase (cycloisomerase 2 family)
MINADGSLSQLSNSPVGESFGSPVSLLVDNSGKYLFVANQASTNLAGYSIGSDGAITLLTGSPFGTSGGPNVIASDPSGKFLFVGSQGGSSIQSFSLDGSTGTLTSVATYSSGATNSIAVSP